VRIIEPFGAGGGPDEGLGITVVAADVFVDGVFQLSGGAMYAAAELLVGQQGKPSLYQVEPACGCGREVKMKAWPFGRPVGDQLGFVGAVAVQDQVYLKICGHIFLDGVQEVAKFHRADSHTISTFSHFHPFRYRSRSVGVLFRLVSPSTPSLPGEEQVEGALDVFSLLFSLFSVNKLNPSGVFEVARGGVRKLT
jgi:hypothetical protein